MNSQTYYVPNLKLIGTLIVLDQLGFEHHWSHDVLLPYQDTTQSDLAVWLEAAD